MITCHNCHEQCPIDIVFKKFFSSVHEYNLSHPMFVYECKLCRIEKGSLCPRRHRDVYTLTIFTRRAVREVLEEYCTLLKSNNIPYSEDYNESMFFFEDRM